MPQWLNAGSRPPGSTARRRWMSSATQRNTQQPNPNPPTCLPVSGGRGIRMSEEKNAFREAAIEAISDMAQHLPLDCELLVVACRPGKKDFDVVLPSPESNLNNAI